MSAADLSTDLLRSVITELIIGYALPGRPVAMMMFKTWGYITMAQALTFTSDFKLGHYMKIPPRPMFWSQVVATVVAGTVQLGVQAWMFTNIQDICSPDQKDGFIVRRLEAASSSTQRADPFPVPIHRGLRHRVYHLGCHWTSTPVLTRTSLLVSIITRVCQSRTLTRRA